MRKRTLTLSALLVMAATGCVTTPPPSGSHVTEKVDYYPQSAPFGAGAAPPVIVSESALYPQYHEHRYENYDRKYWHHDQ